MGIRVGITALKLSNKPSSKSRKSRTGKLRSIACEGLEERYGHDKDIDPKRAALNTYEGITSGQELHRVLTEEAEEYSRQRKAAGGRALRSEAAIGFVSIIKPHVDDLATMTPDQQERFIKDADETLEELLGKKTRARAIHRDEQGIHSHNFFDAWTPDGRICVDDIVNPRLFTKLNVDFVERMREKGWDVEPHELYDAERAERDDAYAAERQQRRQERGRESGRYKADQDAKREAERAADRAELKTRQNELDTQATQQQRVQKFQASKAQELIEREKAVKQRETAVTAREKALPRLATEAAMKAVQAEIKAANEARRRPDSNEAAKNAVTATQAAISAYERVNEQKQRQQQKNFSL